MLKKFATWILFPLSLILLLQCIGFIKLLCGQRSGIRWLFAGFALFIIVSFGVGFPRFVYHLERIHPPFANVEAMTQAYPKVHLVRWIVVLGAGAFESPSASPISQLPPIAVARVAEAVRLHRQLPNTKLLFCGGSVFTQAVEAQIMGQLAADLGIEKSAIELEEQSKDTADQARAVRLRLERGPIFLITSAWHLPRAVRLFHQQGIEVIPIPADYVTHDDSTFTLTIPMPFSENIGTCEIAIKQALGLAWESLRKNNM